jgi:hypothetical protein
MRWRSANHSPSVLADGLYLAGALVDGDDRRLEHDHAAAAAIDDGVRGPEIDRELAFRRTRPHSTPETHHSTLAGTATTPCAVNE